MPGKFYHEELYRGADRTRRLADVRVALCGAGALGSHLADNLARQGFRRLRVIDRDRVEEHNVSTQTYGESDVGAWKVDILRSRLFRAVGVEIEAVRAELTDRNARKLLGGSDVVVDTFDNAASRRLVQDTCRAQRLTCLHVGLSADYAEIIWDDGYRVPAGGAEDVCDYPLARNLILLAVAVASEALIAFVLDGAARSWSVTLRDFAVRPLESPSQP